MMRDELGAVPAWRRYVRFWRSDPAGDVKDELEFHLQSTIDELIAGGMTPQAAREAARRKFGDVERIQRTLYTLSQQRERHMTRSEWIDTIRNDVVYALRQLAKAPAFTAVAVLTLALGIGANTAIYSVVYNVLLKPLPYANADRVYTLLQRNGSNPMCCLPFGNYLEWRRQSTAFETLGAIWGGAPLTITGRGDPLPVRSWWASASYWRALSIPPVVGRYFTEEEDRYGAPRVVILSHALWQSRFGGDRSIVGQTITIEAGPVMVVGVAPPEYVLSGPTERIWIPLAPPPERFTDFSDHELTVYGLLKPGVSVEAAVAQLTQIDTRLAREHPNSGYDGGVIATHLEDKVLGDHRKTLYMLLGAVGLVLLIACANIANLLLARANVRRGEIAIRGALGATRGRIVSQLLVESIVLALAGGVLGLAVALVGTRFLVSSPALIPRLKETTIDAPVLAFALALALGCAILFGLVPALRAARLDLQQTLRDGGRESRTASRERLRGALVVAELCVAQILLIGAGLLIRSTLLLQAVPVGFDTNNLLVASIHLPRARYESARLEPTFQQIEQAIAAIPAVKAVGRSQVAPIYGNGWSWTAFREGSNGHDDGATDSNMRGVSASYFTALGLKVIRGRAFTASDTKTSPPVAIVSDGLARRLFGDADPIGRRIANGNGQHPEWREIVGVVDDMHADGLAEDPPRELYMPVTQWAQQSQTLVIRGAVPVTSLLPSIRRAVAGVDPLLALANVSTMEQALDNHLAMERFTTWLLGLLGGTGLVLAVVGVYGVVAYFVTQRTREFGVRLALGSSAANVQWLVVRQGLLLALLGVVIGVGVSFAFARLLRTMVYGITPNDPITFVAVSAILALVTLAASYLPARRATRIDPLDALRST